MDRLPAYVLPLRRTLFSVSGRTRPLYRYGFTVRLPGSTYTHTRCNRARLHVDAGYMVSARRRYRSGPHTCRLPAVRGDGITRCPPVVVPCSCAVYLRHIPPFATLVRFRSLSFWTTFGVHRILRARIYLPFCNVHRLPVRYFRASLPRHLPHIHY